MTKNNERREAFKKLGKAISRYNRRNSDGPTLFNPWYVFHCEPLDDPALTSKLGNRFLKAHKSSKGPATKTVKWEATGRRTR